MSNVSGFKTKTEAEKEGILAYNDYLNIGSSFSVRDISYADFLDYLKLFIMN